MIELEAVRKSFGSQVVLDGIDLAIPTGETVAVLGRSGSGKSVLLKQVARLMRPDGGTVRVGEVEMSRADKSTVMAVRSSMGYVFQFAALFDSLTVGENVALPLREQTRLSEDEILDLYLNRIYFGHGRYGVAEAARFYLDKSVQALTVGLVEHDIDVLAAAAQTRCNLFITEIEPVARVEQQQHGIGFFHGHPHLFCHQAVQTLLRADQAAGIDHQVGPLADLPVTVLAVAGQPGIISDQRIATAGQPVEQSRFADVGPADQRNYRQQSADPGREDADSHAPAARRRPPLI